MATTTLDDYRRSDPMFRVRKAARALRSTAQKPGQPAWTEASQRVTAEKALRILKGEDE